VGKLSLYLRSTKYAGYTLVALGALAFLNGSAEAKWGKLTVTDGSGDNLEMHSYPLGLGKGWQAQDQLGDSFGYKRGIFGINKTTEGSVLGNNVKVHKGLISGTSVDAQDMFGDNVKSHKFLKIGPRITTVNVQGISGLANSMMHHSATPTFAPTANNGFGAPALGASPEAQMHPEAAPMPMSSGPVDPSGFANPPGSP
jgi:hypothetical protein